MNCPECKSTKIVESGRKRKELFYYKCNDCQLEFPSEVPYSEKQSTSQRQKISGMF